MRIGTSYKQHHGLAESWDAIVIGSGIGGLTTAATLSKLAGRRVLVLERHYTAGGFTHTFRRPGYEWDVGVHYIGGVSHPKGAARRMFDFISDGELQWADMGDCYDRIIVGDRAYDLVKGYDNLRAKLKDYFPEETAAIDRYLEKVVATAKKAQLYFAEKSVPPFVSKLFGGAMRRHAMKDARRTTRDVLEEITQNQELIAVLTGQYGDYGLVPAESSWFIHSMVVAHYLRGAGYPVGGSARIAETVLPVIEKTGGQVLTNAEVSQVLVEKGRAAGVEMRDGRTLRAPLVISDAGVINTFEQLLPATFESKLRFAAKAREIGTSIAHLCLYIGLKGTAEELQLEKTNLWVYHDHAHEKHFERFSNDINAPFPVVYLSFPSAKDPAFNLRHPGRSTIEAITLGRYERFQPWQNTSWKKRGSEYDELKARLSERLLDVVYAHAPAARGHVEIAELSTPLSTQKFAAHPRGAIYGLAHTPSRYEQRWLRSQTPIEGLFLTGADVASAGVVGAMMGGYVCASAVLKGNVLGQVLKQHAQARGSEALAGPSPGRA